MPRADGDPWIRNAVVIGVHDGDTVTLDVDLGYFAHCHVPHRLVGINAPELNTPEGKASRDYLREILPVGSEVVVRSHKDGRTIASDKYGGRFLADLVRKADGVSINRAMVDSGMALEWNGKGVKPSAG